MLKQKQYLIRRWNKTFIKVLDCYMDNISYQIDVNRICNLIETEGNVRWRMALKHFCKKWRVDKCAIKSYIPPKTIRRKR